MGRKRSRKKSTQRMKRKEDNKRKEEAVEAQHGKGRDGHKRQMLSDVKTERRWTD